MSRYLIATIKSWNIHNYYTLKEKYFDSEFMLVSKKEELTLSFLEEYQPDYIFFPHWSWIIPEEIYNNYNCVVFHSTDLPYGRGGSPLQNLIIRGVYNTKISAIKVCSELDAGPIYLKEPIDISEGNADEIFGRISEIIFQKMIPRFLEEDLIPVEQKGEVVVFNRRKPNQSEIPKNLSQRQMYDFVRMLDGEGYPVAFTKYENGRFEYRNARLIDGKFYADVSYVEDKK